MRHTTKTEKMTKKEILKQWLDEPKVRYCGKSNFTLGYGDGWDWVKDTLRPTITKNAMFLRLLEQVFREIEEFLKPKSEKPSEEDCTLYSVGYKDGVKDAMIAIKNRFEKLKFQVPEAFD